MATQVPYSPEPQVSSQLSPTPASHVQAPIGAFGGLTAAATEHIGAAISQSGNEIFDRANAMQLLNQQAHADEGSSQFQLASAKRHADYGVLQGKDAVDGLQPMLDGIEQDRQKIRSTLTSPYAQMQYDRDTRRMQGQMFMSAASHAAQQQKVYQAGSLQARSDTADNAALSLPEDDTAFQHSLDEKDDIAKNMADIHGWSPEETEAWATKAKSTLTSNRIEGISKTDPFTAERMLDTAIADKNIVGQDIARITSKIYYQQNTIGARVTANQILSGEGSVAGGGPVPLSTAATSIGQFMSKDNYDLIGRAHDGSGQALGRYGVPAEKLSSMLKDANMADMTPADFLKSHSAQDQLFQTTFGKYQDDAGNFNDAVKKWTGQETKPLSNSGTSEQQTAFSFFKSKGWSDDYAHAMVATLSGESGVHLSTMANQKAGGRNWENRFKVSDPGNGIANWDNARSKSMETWARSQGMNPNKLEAQLAFVDYEARQMGFDPTKSGDPRQLTMELTGSTDEDKGYEKPLVNNGADRWAKYSGQRYANDPVIQQTNGLIARNTPLSDLVDQAKTKAANLAPNNPLFGEYLTDRVQGLYRQQVYQQAQIENQNKQVLEQALNIGGKDGQVPTSIEQLYQDPAVAQAYDHASPVEQNRIQGVLARNLQAGGVVFTPETFQKYSALHTAAIDPSATPQERQALLDANVSDLNIPLKARQQLFNDQKAVSKQEEASPQMSRALRVLEPTLNTIGLTKTLDRDNYNSFVTQLHAAIQEHTRDVTKPITDEDITQIGAQLLRNQPSSGFSSWLFSPTKWYQLPVPEEYSSKARSDPRWEKVGVDPTDEMIRSMYVQQQFQQFYAKSGGQK